MDRGRGRHAAPRAERLPDLAFVDFGGGFGVPYRPEERPFDVDAFGAAVAPGSTRSNEASAVRSNGASNRVVIPSAKAGRCSSRSPP
jgi:hypothetical protein